MNCKMQLFMIELTSLKSGDKAFIGNHTFTTQPEYQSHMDKHGHMKS